MATYYKLDEEERAEIKDKLKRRKALLDELSGLTNKAISTDYGCSAEVVRCMFNDMNDRLISGE